jgi:tripartite ATP-independent transporter DctM subunit
MDIAALALVAVAALAVFLLGGLWIALALIGVGLVTFFVGTNAPAGAIMATTIWGGSASWTLTALPLFIWMGEILFRTRLSEELFKGLSPWLNWLPGRLLHVNVVGSGIFAAACGSSAATMATIGRISLPELAKRGYDSNVSIGSLVGAGTLGIMIPPSITFIVYGVSAEISIARLFAAGIVPGLMLMALFMSYIIGWSLINRHRMPPAEPSMRLPERISRSRHLIPIVLLIVLVIGSIYAGIATPTESAGMGVAGALVLSALSGTLTRANFIASVREAVRTSCMISFIVMGSLFLSASMDFVGLPQWIAKYISSFNLSSYALLAVLTALFAVLGCFLDGISIVVLASSLLLPSVQQSGIDLIWFGVFMVLMVEMSMVTPPVGLNLFVMQLMTGRGLGYVSLAAVPFFVLMIVAVVILVAFPQLATYLPGKLY